VAAILILLVWALWIDWQMTVRFLIALVTGFYALHLAFMLFLVVRSFRDQHEIVVTQKERFSLEDSELPLYTILCPLYREWRVLPQFLKAIESLDWPKEKLDVLLLLEADDQETIEAITRLDLPAHFRVLVVPKGELKTKPKACNYGLLHSRGEYTVIYDAEDVPAPDQLKKAYLVFQKTKHRPVVCAQAKLDFYNIRQNFLTRLFATEYALWFDLILIGLQSARCPIPLGGTSNHFRTRDLQRLSGWDAFNVTEDCDLGMRIAKMGFETVIFNSTTYEEANSDVRNWLRQRSRWIKGYMQTYLVHMREPGAFIERAGMRSFLAFQLVVGGKIIALFVNPFFWLLTLAYIAFHPFIGPTVETLYPPLVLYLSVFALTVGNFLYLYYSVLGALRRGQYDLVKYVALIPFYWLCMSIAAWKALTQLIFRPSYWEKTIHGLHLDIAEPLPARTTPVV
jgi:cellulose synthase/poly-beta-1,6-N-acetylglucosamine synthase-like glycosyltransferase